MSSVSQLKPFLEPKSIAVVGANPNSGEQAFNVVENLANCGYQGKVYPVNPNYKEILGKKCYPSVKEIPGNKPIAWCPYDGWLFDIRSRDLADKLEEAGKTAVFSIPDDAVRALARLADYSEFRNRTT